MLSSKRREDPQPEASSEKSNLRIMPQSKKINAGPYKMVLTKDFQPALRKYESKCTKFYFILLNIVWVFYIVFIYIHYLAVFLHS